jgi:hypothetical protein
MTGTNCDLFTHIVPVIFEPPCIIAYHITINEGTKIFRQSELCD